MLSSPPVLAESHLIYFICLLFVWYVLLIFHEFSICDLLFGARQATSVASRSSTSAGFRRTTGWRPPWRGSDRVGRLAPTLAVHERAQDRHPGANSVAMICQRWQEKVCQHVSCYVDLWCILLSNCLSHVHSFSLLSQKCLPQQWRERERESNKNMLTVCSFAHPERMVSILVPAVLRLAGAQKWKVPNPSMRSMWLARCCCPVHWEGWVGLPTTPLNKEAYWSPWGRSFSIFFLEFQPIICALVLQSWVQNKLLQTGQ